MHVRENLNKLRTEIPSGVKLVAVSKMMPANKIMEAYNCGQKIFGENKSQELTEKQPILPDDISWHFIGHLQTNKVRSIVPFVDMIESVDSLRLLKEIDKEAGRHNRTVKCLLQFHIAKEETKFGLEFQEAEAILACPEFKALQNLRICGVMGMASFSDDEGLVRAEFSELRNIFFLLKDKFFKTDPYFSEISMGMTGDYRIAIEEGSTIIRIGTGIFS